MAAEFEKFALLPLPMATALLPATETLLPMATALAPLAFLPPWPREHDDPASPESRYLGAPIQSVPEIAAASDPTSYVSTAGALPPFLIVHGDDDHLVPHLQSVLLADELLAHGGEADLRILPGYGHGGPGWVEEVLPASIDWLDEVLARE